MDKKKIILRTQGINNTSEVGIVILPERFYVKTQIYEVGDFNVEIIDSCEEQLFCACYNVGEGINRTPSREERVKAENELSKFIVDSLAEHLLDETAVTFDTEEHLKQWACKISYIFKDFLK